MVRKNNDNSRTASGDPQPKDNIAQNDDATADAGDNTADSLPDAQPDGGAQGDDAMTDAGAIAEDSLPDAQPGEAAEIDEPETDEGSAPPAPAPVFEKELAAEKDKYLRLLAEYDNFRKRTTREREKIYNDAYADAVTRLLPVYDNLERALSMECADEAFYKGIKMTMAQLSQIFDDMDIKQIPSVGEPFDPNLHNAVRTIKASELGEKIVAEEYQKGFILGNRMIRHSTVVVAN